VVPVFAAGGLVVGLAAGVCEELAGGVCVELGAAVCCAPAWPRTRIPAATVVTASVNSFRIIVLSHCFAPSANHLYEVQVMNG